MFELTTFLLDPLLSGISVSRLSLREFQFLDLAFHINLLCE